MLATIPQLLPPSSDNVSSKSRESALGELHDLASSDSVCTELCTELCTGESKMLSPTCTCTAGTCTCTAPTSLEQAAQPTTVALREELPEGISIEAYAGVGEDAPQGRSIGTPLMSLPPVQQEHLPRENRGSSGKLREPKRMYGREHEQAAIRDAYEQAIRGEKTDYGNVVLVKGSAGIGKTALADSLRDIVLQDGGFFMTWKFDHESQLESGDGFTDAFTSLRDQILNARDEVTQDIRDSLRALGPVDCDIILGLIPFLEPIIGHKQTDVDPFGVEASGRQLRIFKNMMQTFSTKERPLVVVFDDIQFSDRCSHLLLQELVADSENEGCLYVCTMGPEEPAAPIDMVLTAYEENANVNMTSLELDPLGEETTNIMIADILKVEPQDCIPLTEFLYYYTKGNPLFVKEMLRLMLENEVLVFDEESKTWNCKEERMDCVYRCKDFETLVGSKLIRCSDPVKEVLKAAACIGTKIDVAFLDVVMSGPVSKHLQMAVSFGLVVQVDAEKGKYRFANNGVRQSAYSLIADDELEGFHLAIGRKLLKGFTDEQLQEYLSLIIGQVKRGASSITSQKERNTIAALCLNAAEQAVDWSNFDMAAEALDFAISLLCERCWRDEYELSLTVYNMAAEVAYTVGAHGKVHERADVVLSNARVIDHKLHAYCTKINSLTATANIQGAIRLGLDVLERIGEPVRDNPSSRHVALEYARIKRFMKSTTIEKLRRLPTMTDHRKAAALQIINLIAMPCIFGNPLLMPLLTFKAVRITVANGLCAISSVAFGLYGMVLAGYARKLDDANNLAHLSLELLERFDAKQWIPRVHLVVYGAIFPWSRDMNSCIEPLQKGYDVGMETGDLEFALLNGVMKCTYSFCLGSPLPLVKIEMEKFTAAMMKSNQETLLIVHHALFYMIEALMASDSLAVFNGLVQNEGSILNEPKASDFIYQVWFVFKRMVLSYIAGDYATANAEARKISFDKVPVAGIDLSLLFMFDALSRMAYCKQTGKKKRKTLAVARDRLAKLKSYATSNPRFCCGMRTFVEAELAVLQGKRDNAKVKYFACIAMFGREKMLPQLGMACERAGKFMIECGMLTDAIDYLRESHRAFEEWGAKGKCDALKVEIDELFGRENLSASKQGTIMFTIKK